MGDWTACNWWSGNNVSPKRDIGKLIQAIKDGVAASAIKDELLALEERKDRLDREILKSPDAAPRLHPTLPKSTARKSPAYGTRSTMRQRESKLPALSGNSSRRFNSYPTRRMSCRSSWLVISPKYLRSQTSAPAEMTRRGRK